MVKFRAKLGEKEFELEASGEGRIAEAKSDLERQSGIPPAQQKWIYQGRILGDDMTILSAGIADGYVVHVLKVGGVPNAAPSLPPSSAAPLIGNTAAPRIPVIPAATSYVPPPPPTAQLVRRFDEAMKLMLGNSESAVQTAVGLFLKIVINIVEHPSEDKYRRIKASNSAFATKILAINGGKECLWALGFSETNGEWILYPSAQAWEVLLAVKKKLEVFSDRLAKAGESVAPSPVKAPAASINDPAQIQAVQDLLKGLAAFAVTSGSSDGNPVGAAADEEEAAPVSGAEASILRPDDEEKDTTKPPDSST